MLVIAISGQLVGAAEHILFAASGVGVTAVLLLAAGRADREHADPDRPRSIRWLGAPGLAVAVALVLLVAGFAAEIQDELRQGLFRTYPVLRRQPSGELVLTVWPRRGTRAKVVDERHRPTGAVVDLKNVEWMPSLAVALGFGHNWTGREPARRVPCSDVGSRSCVLDRGGMLTVIRTTTGRDARCERGVDPCGPESLTLLVQSGKGPEHRAFTTKALIVGEPWGNVAWIAEPDDGSLWRLDLGHPERGFTPPRCQTATAS
jgi:hypothetical protein